MAWSCEPPANTIRAPTAEAMGHETTGRAASAALCIRIAPTPKGALAIQQRAAPRASDLLPPVAQHLVDDRPHRLVVEPAPHQHPREPPPGHHRLQPLQ